MMGSPMLELHPKGHTPGKANPFFLEKEVVWVCPDNLNFLVDPHVSDGRSRARKGNTTKKEFVETGKKTNFRGGYQIRSWFS